jgi:hypothetical protein
VSTDLNSFDQSPLNAFVQSPLDARNTPDRVGLIIPMNVRFFGSISFQNGIVIWDDSLTPRLAFPIDESQRIQNEPAPWFNLSLAGTAERLWAWPRNPASEIWEWSITGFVNPVVFRSLSFQIKTYLIGNDLTFGSLDADYLTSTDGLGIRIAYAGARKFWAVIDTLQRDGTASSFVTYVALFSWPPGQTSPSVIDMAPVDADDIITPTGVTLEGPWPHSRFWPEAFGGWEDGPIASRIVGSDSRHLFEFNGLRRSTFMGREPLARFLGFGEPQWFLRRRDVLYILYTRAGDTYIRAVNHRDLVPLKDKDGNDLIVDFVLPGQQLRTFVAENSNLEVTIGDTNLGNGMTFARAAL